MHSGLENLDCSRGIFLRGNALVAVVTCISHSFLSKKKVRAIGDLVHACCLSFGRWKEPPYLATMYLVSPWYISPSWPWS